MNNLHARKSITFQIQNSSTNQRTVTLKILQHGMNFEPSSLPIKSSVVGDTLQDHFSFTDISKSDRMSMYSCYWQKGKDNSFTQVTVMTDE
jgi:hypothetical protein